MIPKSGNRFSDKIMLNPTLKADPVVTGRPVAFDLEQRACMVAPSH
jgi:hypothetical protein